MELVAAIGMILAALFLLRSEWEKLQLVTVRYRVTAGKPAVETGTDPNGKPGLRLLFISDLHDYIPARHTPEKILSMIDEEAPDAVLIGGDMITVSKFKEHPEPKTETALSLIRKLAEKYPVYYGEGNHESRLKLKNPEAYGDYVEALLKAGVRYLADTSEELELPYDRENQSVSDVLRQNKAEGTEGMEDASVKNAGGQGENLPQAADRILITGVSLEPEYYQPKPGFGLDMHLPEGYLKAKLPEDRTGYRILLLHHPGFLKEAAAEGIDLVLSGHMHGGTLRFPGGTGLMTPQYRFFVKECSGEFHQDKTTMLVTRGLGTHSVKLRFNDLPELTVIDIFTEHPAGTLLHSLSTVPVTRKQ